MTKKHQYPVLVETLNNGPEPSAPDQKPRAVLYARVSTQKQLDRITSDYDSLETQEDLLRRYCEKQGFEVFDVVTDVKSSKSLDRPGIGKILSYAREGLIDVVCAIRHDRIAGADEFGGFKAALWRHGVRLRLSEEVSNPDTPGGRLIGRVLVAAKEHDREVLGEKVRAKFREHARKEKFSTGPAPFGFRKDPETLLLEPHPEQAPIVRGMFDVYLRTRSDFAVRDWLKDHGVASPGGKSEWSVSSVEAVLTNLKHGGFLELNTKFKGKRVQNEDEQHRVVRATTFPSTVPAEVWEAAQRVRAEQAQKHPRPAKRRKRPLAEFTREHILAGELRGPTHRIDNTKIDHVFILRGKLFCPLCGHPMSPDYVEHKPNEKEQRKSHSIIPYYTCSLWKKYPALARSVAQGEKEHGRVHAGRVEQWVLREIASMIRINISLADLRHAVEHLRQSDADSLTPALSCIAANLREVDRKQRLITNLLIEGSLNEDSLALVNEQAHELALRRKRLVAEEADLRAQMEGKRFSDYSLTMQQVLSNLKSSSEHVDRHQLRELVSLMVHRITCGKSRVYSAEFYCLNLPEELYPELLQRNSNGELEWKQAGSIMLRGGVLDKLHRLESELKNENPKSKRRRTKAKG